MRLLKNALLAFSFFFVAMNANAQLEALDGNWYSTQWKYGYVLKDGVGVATSTNSPNFQVGQNILRLTAISATTFTGQQVYTDGKFYKVNAKLQADGRLYFEGEKNAKWVMDRIGAAPQKSVPSSQSTQPTTSAATSASTSPSFDCQKATTVVEKLICSDPDLSKLDVSLAETYKEATSKDRSIRDDQRAWNAEKNKCADADCLKSAYEDRISELTNFIVQHDRAALNQPQSSVNTSNEVDDEYSVSLGICAGALAISNPSDTYTQKVWAKISNEVERHDSLFKAACGSNPQPGPALAACFESLPRATRIFFNARGMAANEMRSSQPLSFMKNNMQGNSPTVHGIVKMAHCPSAM